MNQRAIKFRAWDGHKIWWVETWDELQDKSLQIMQFTGLKDKNGKEIYEGDIVLCKAMNESKSVVEYRLAEFVLADGSFVEPISRLVLFKWSMEIIGNIYDNPDLLKESNN